MTRLARQRRRYEEDIKPKIISITLSRAGIRFKGTTNGTASPWCRLTSSWPRISYPAVQRSFRSANLPNPITQVTSQERSQGDAISVANTFGNLIDALIAGLQEMDRAFDPQTLEIG